MGAGEVPATALEPLLRAHILFFYLTRNHLEIDAKEFIMNWETSSSTGSVHNYYERFINSYKTFVVSFSRLHFINSRKTDICRVSVYVAVRSMDGVQDYYAKD